MDHSGGPHAERTLKAYAIGSIWVCSNQIWLAKGKEIRIFLSKKDLPNSVTSDWRCPYMEYLTCKKILDQTLPPKVKKAVKQSHKYFVFTNDTFNEHAKEERLTNFAYPRLKYPGF